MIDLTHCFVCRGVHVFLGLGPLFLFLSSRRCQGRGPLLKISRRG